jgi:hypothetical protein
MHQVFLHTRLRPTGFSFPTAIKQTIIQPLEAEIQTMVMIELWWSTLHLTPSAIPSLSWMKNEVLQHFSQFKNLPLMQCFSLTVGASSKRIE